MENTSMCPACHQPISTDWYFCANCGKELNFKPVKISAVNQIGIYLLSIFIPPLGLFPGIKYLRKTGRDAKIVGSVAIVLTLISSAISIRLIFSLLQLYLSAFDGLI